MDFEKARFNMVAQQIRPWDVLDMKVLDALLLVKREAFVPRDLQDLAFTDAQLPIGHGQFMLEPRVQGRLLQALTLRETDKVLQIGTGTGYTAALLAAQTQSVRSFEIEPELARQAQANLATQQITNVTVHQGDALGDGSKEALALCAENAPYDVILVSGALPKIPQALIELLAPQGRLIAFVGEAPLMHATLVTCTESGQYSSTVVFEGVAPQMEQKQKISSFVF